MQSTNKEEIKHCFLFLCRKPLEGVCRDSKGNICVGIGDNPDCEKVTCANCSYGGNCLAHSYVREIMEGMSN